MGRSQGQRRKTAAMLLGGAQKIGNRNNLIKMKTMPGSGSIKAIGYDNKNQRLYLAFKSKHPKRGQGYYEEVPKEIYQSMVQSKSPNQFQKDYLKARYRWHFSESKDLDLI
jgi:hypothetical protein